MTTETLTARPYTAPTLNSPGVQKMLATERAVNEAATDLVLLLTAAPPVPPPTGNVAQLRDALIAAGYLDHEGNRA